jgi:hypothetical protein
MLIKGMRARQRCSIVGFGETRIHAETAPFEVRASEIVRPRRDDQLVVGRQTFVMRGEAESRSRSARVDFWHLIRIA